jgi:DNA-binding GntR family transcriptional regulator
VMADRYRYIARGSPRSSSKDRDVEHRSIAEAVIARRADEAVVLLSRHFETTASLCQTVFRRGKTARGARKP